MKKALIPYAGQRLRFQAKVERFGIRPAYCGFPIKTILLKYVRILDDTMTLVADHLWMPTGKWSEDFRGGETIAFDADVGYYEKGYKNQKGWDLHLENPTNSAIITKRDTTQ